MKKLMVLSFASMFMVAISSFAMETNFVEPAPCEKCEKGKSCEKQCKKGEAKKCCKADKKKSESTKSEKSNKSTNSDSKSVKS